MIDVQNVSMRFNLGIEKNNSLKQMAVAMQAVLVAAMMSASVIAAWVTLVAARRFVLDVYGRIKNIKPDVNHTDN